MMNNKMSNLSALVGAAFVASAVLAPIASAADATFNTTTLDAGYTLADNHATKSDGEHKCGEGKCAADHKSSSADKKADGEHKCGEGKCGADKKAEGEGKCGEGKCGADKKEKSDSSTAKKAE
ncbi:MAG: hypothetical protein B0W54_08700 [Cellvibrio sp. 79]|nr:MAG: hypothetical protein B0W54_08700 [Cellvibrio sp. 79]